MPSQKALGPSKSTCIYISQCLISFSEGGSGSIGKDVNHFLIARGLVSPRRCLGGFVQHCVCESRGG